MSGIVLNTAGLTHKGQVRSVNEDDFIIDNEISLFAVADGLGGHGSGNVASSLTVETLQIEVQKELQAITENQHEEGYQLSQILKNAINAANTVIYNRNKQKGFGDGKGMGATLVGVCFFGNNERFISFNIGDSRLYQLANGTLSQTTKDHSLLQEWLDMGQIGAAPPANLLKRAVGLFPDINVDVALHETKSMELLMLCSDGLTAMVDDSLIGRMINDEANKTPVDICQSLIDSANYNGGVDNITVIAIRRI